MGIITEIEIAIVAICVVAALVFWNREEHQKVLTMQAVTAQHEAKLKLDQAFKDEAAVLESNKQLQSDLTSYQQTAADLSATLATLRAQHDSRTAIITKEPADACLDRPMPAAYLSMFGYIPTAVRASHGQ